MVCTHCRPCYESYDGASAKCGTEQLLINEKHLSRLGAPLLWAILVDFYQVSDSSSPTGAEVAPVTPKHLGY